MRRFAAVLAVLVACGCGAPLDGSAAETSSTETSSTETAEPGVTSRPQAVRATPAPALPRFVVPQLDDTVWAVYLAVAQPGSARLDEAVERASKLGLETAPTHLGCDEGAPEALHLPPHYESVAVYFGTEADARRFAELKPPVDGVVKVHIGCP